MAKTFRLHVEVEGKSIIVTQPGTRRMVKYQKQADATDLSQLTCKETRTLQFVSLTSSLALGV